MTSDLYGWQIGETGSDNQTIDHRQPPVKYLELVEERPEWETPLRTRLNFPTDEMLRAAMDATGNDFEKVGDVLEAVRQVMFGETPEPLPDIPDPGYGVSE